MTVSTTVDGTTVGEGPTTRELGAHRYAWLLAGGLLSLFAWHGPWDLAAAAWLYPILLLRFTRDSRPRSGFLAVWGVQTLSGVGFLYATGLLTRLPAPVSVGATVAAAGLLTAPYLLDRFVVTRWGSGGGLPATLVFPTARVSVEFLLAQVGPYGAFIVLGTTQHRDIPLIQIASVTGVYGISFLLAWLAPVANLVWSRYRPDPTRGVQPGSTTVDRAWMVAAVYAAIIGVVFGAGAARLAFATPAGPTVRVAAIAPAADGAAARATATARLRKQYGSFSAVLTQAPEELRTALAGVTDDLIDRTTRQATAGSRIIAWSETAAWVRQQDESTLLERVRTITRTHHVYVLVGMVVYTSRQPMLHNQAVLVTPDGRLAWRYDKAHPTPMEGIPPGNGRVPVDTTPYGRLANVICFDADFPALMRQAASRGTDLMLVPSHDWPDIARVHAERAAFRAVEDGYPILRPAGDGRSTAVDRQGRVIAAADTTADGAHDVVVDMPTGSVATVYRTVGDLFAWLCVLGLAVLMAAGARRATRTGAGHRSTDLCDRRHVLGDVGRPAGAGGAP